MRFVVSKTDIFCGSQQQLSPQTILAVPTSVFGAAQTSDTRLLIGAIAKQTAFRDSLF